MPLKAKDADALCQTQSEANTLETTKVRRCHQIPSQLQALQLPSPIEITLNVVPRR